MEEKREDELRELLDEYHEAVSYKERLRCMSALYADPGLSKLMYAAFAECVRTQEKIVAFALKGGA